MAEVRIRAAHSLCWPAGDEPRPLQGIIRRLCPDPPRRLNRFTQLALAGVLGCVRGVELPPGCALYLASAYGGADDISRLVADMTLRRESPMPVDFINASGSSTGFHLARTLGLRGRNQSLSAGAASFEAALDLAWGVLAGRPGLALVGDVEEASWPLADHRRRIGLATGAPVRELSAWVLLDSRAQARGPILAEPRYFKDVDSLLAELGQRGDGALHVGAGFTAAQRRELVTHRGERVAPEDDAAKGSVFAALIESGRQELVHVAADDAGGCYLLELLPP